VRFSVVPSGKDERVKRQDKVVRRVRVLADVTAVSANFWLSESAKATAADSTPAKATYPGTLSSPLSGAPTQYLYSELALTTVAKDFQPAQVFLQLCRSGTPKCAVFPAAPKSDTKYDGKFIAKINLGSEEVVRALYGAGDYEIQVMIGDSVLVKSLRWRVGTVSVRYSGEQAKDSHVDPFAPAPDIHHQFRPAETRPHSIIAYAFTAVSVVPFVLLLIMLGQISPNVYWPTEAQESLYSFIFQLSILLILMSYVWYWFALNIFQALTIASILGVVAVFSGNRSLRLLNRRRNAEPTDASSPTAAEPAAEGEHPHTE